MYLPDGGLVFNVEWKLDIKGYFPLDDEENRDEIRDASQNGQRLRNGESTNLIMTNTNDVVFFLK